MTGKPNPQVFVAMTVATLVLGGGLVYYQNNAAGEQAAKVAKLRDEARDPNQLQREVDASNAQVAETAMQLAHLEKGVPEMAYVPTLLKELEICGKQNGIEVLGVRPIVAVVPANGKQKAPRKAYSELDIEVRGRGNYASTMRFVHDLKAFPKILAARTVTLTPKQDFVDATGAPLLDLTVQLRAYLFDPNFKTPTIAAKTTTLSEHRREVETYE